MEFFCCSCEISCERKDGSILSFEAGGDAIDIDVDDMQECIKQNDIPGFLRAFRALGLHCTFDDSEIEKSMIEAGGFSGMQRITLSYQDVGADACDEEDDSFDSSYSIVLYGIFSGMRFALNGKMKLFQSRDTLTEYIENRGGEVSGSVTKKTNYLIDNSETENAKIKKAKGLGVPVITEEQFVALFGKPQTTDVI